MHTLPLLRLERKLDSRLWGGDALGVWLGLENPPAQLAESWQVYEHNTIIGGPFDGRTLADVIQEHGAALVGTRSFKRNGAEFPLLAKFLDAGDHLSVQVHPDDEYAHSKEASTGFHGKTEAWYILRAKPGAELIHGLIRDTSREEFGSAVENGTLMELLREVPVAAGDTVFVPAGTIHAINAGIMLFEIQQKSDLTYRVYDYDRRDANGKLRELHLDRALDVTDYHATPPAKVEPNIIDAVRSTLVDCPYFVMERWHLDGPYDAATDAGSFDILTGVEGEVLLSGPGGDEPIRQGESVVLPATFGSYRLLPGGDGATLLRCYVP